MIQIIIALPAAFALLNAANFPARDKSPPIDQTIVNQYLQNANIPNLPVNKLMLSNPDTSADISSCQNADDWALTYDDGYSI
jgi:hypothetical protein